MAEQQSITFPSCRASWSRDSVSLPTREPKQHMSSELDATSIAMASAACGPRVRAWR